MGKLTIPMTFDKSTPGTHRYADKSDNSPLPTMYIKKHGLPTTKPREIVVTIEWKD